MRDRESSVTTHEKQTKVAIGARPLRIALVGCGAIAEVAHLPAILASPEVELAALVDTSAVRLRSTREKFGLDTPGVATPGLESYKELFAWSGADKIDAAVLAIPNFLHASVGVEFLNRGVGVLCEKPLSTRRDEGLRLCEAARQSGATLAVGYVTRFFSSTELTRRLLEMGFLGPLDCFQYEFGTAGGWDTVSGYNLSRETSGGGVLAISGSHFLDRMLFLFGDVEIVRFRDDSRGGLEANCIAEFRANYQGRDLPGRVTLSKTHRLSNYLRVIGEKGVLVVREGESRSVTFLPAGTGLRQEIFPADADIDIAAYTAESDVSQPDYFRIQLEDFVRAIREGTEPRVNGEQGLKSAALMEDCYARAELLDEPWCDAGIDRLQRALPVEESVLIAKR